MDVSFWGPPGWKMLHSITFERGNLETKKRLFDAMKDVLPCKYCRESARQFIKELPFDNNLALWLYKFHNKVNDKLNKQVCVTYIYIYYYYMYIHFYVYNFFA
jgi:hypothetical protein